MKTNLKTNFLDILIGAALMVVVGIMPLIARMVLRPLPRELSHLLPDDRIVDFLSYTKSHVVLAVAAAIAFSYLSDLITNGKMPDFKAFFKKPPAILASVFLVFVLISAVFSSYTRTSWFGTFHRDEGAFMWMAYFVIFFAAMYFAQKLERTKYVLYALAFSSIIMGAIGASQFAGSDFFGTSTGRWLVTVGTPFFDIRHLVAPEFTIAYGTLFNPNTFGKYTAMLAPILLLAALTFRSEKLYITIISSVALFVAGALMLLGVFASSSLGGLMGIITASIVLVVAYLLRPGIPLKKIALTAGPVVGVLVLAILFVPPLNERVTFLFDRIGREMAADTSAISDFVFDRDTMTVYGADGKILSLTVREHTGDWLTVRDAAGNELAPASREQLPPVRHDATSPIEFTSTIYTFDVPDYRRVTIESRRREFRDYRRAAIETVSHDFVYHHARGSRFFLEYIDGRIYGVPILPGPFIDLHREIPAWGFEGRETWGSNRGYIWSRSLPLMPSRTIIGSGPDTFVNVFPNQDMVSGQRYFNNPYQIVDKAHNFFIQTWITTGGISALALFGLFGHYFFTTLRSLIKTKDEPVFSYGLRLGLLAGVAGYVMAGMATDTTVGSTGVFFVLLGIGYGLNEQDFTC
ncbi:MAG: O-antigen ligase family protein [Defluviitaleaceae bacterium]|nr:O-antigen ligase family protein [Defluviitaleaceae bacterium]